MLSRQQITTFERSLMLFTVNRVKNYLTIASAVILPFSAMPAVAFASNNPAAVEQIQAEYTEEEFKELLKEAAQDLYDSDLPREVVEEDGENFIVYELENGGEIGMPASLTHGQSRIRVGPAIKGPWVELTPTEQRMLIAGQEAALVRLICRTTPQGRGICSISTVIASTMFVYLQENGACPNNQRLLIELNWAGRLRGAQCR